MAIKARMTSKGSRIGNKAGNKTIAKITQSMENRPTIRIPRPVKMKNIITATLKITMDAIIAAHSAPETATAIPRPAKRKCPPMANIRIKIISSGYMETPWVIQK
jgi:hypothetical protein